ncbi:Lipopolysaccharide sugar transferase [Ignavibacterium album JCM 16511]|uniref:Lipopolysaccharide sugar transferase n=1 Tax=Ignavibacterium album (strain DSM 19864 / JCM 16511 / NBRC 101810 / Mat9-16) TaxID=945713 RepID=I0ALC2_IGNAJ|nr:sugar transferase [Ignavibacterium album]AFH49779.1 Lipopolysaccharide sugar transferase [Ignavibacterium album JCM 16511]
MGKQGSFLKRFTDILISIIVLIISLPFFIIAMITIKLDSKGPVFFIHERTGYKGKPFRMIKFRGMIDNALAFGPELTQENDPRITRVGKILRRTSFDEVPQFINVLKGDMSIIGPRPEIISITNTYNEYQRKVFDFKPGITGISQINGRQKLTPDQRTKMEIEYYEKENFWTDLKIIFKTFAVVLTNEGNI